MISFSARVKKARQHAKLSQAALARMLGISQQAVGHLENTKETAGGSRYTSAIARACGVSPDWLHNGTGSMLSAGSSTEMREPTSAPYITGIYIVYSLLIYKTYFPHKIILDSLT